MPAKQLVGIGSPKSEASTRRSALPHLTRGQQVAWPPFLIRSDWAGPSPPTPSGRCSYRSVAEPRPTQAPASASDPPAPPGRFGVPEVGRLPRLVTPSLPRVHPWIVASGRTPRSLPRTYRPQSKIPGQSFGAHSVCAPASIGRPRQPLPALAAIKDGDQVQPANRRSRRDVTIAMSSSRAGLRG
jgi:hypothetical protein